MFCTTPARACDNDVDCHGGSVEIVRWKWQGVQRIEGKTGTRLILGRKGCLDLRCSADWIGYNKSFCYASWYFSVGQTTTRRHCPSRVTTRCDREGPGSLEQMVDVSLFAWPDCRGAALHLLIIPRSHKRNPNVTDYIPAAEVGWPARLPDLLHSRIGFELTHDAYQEIRAKNKNLCLKNLHTP